MTAFTAAELIEASEAAALAVESHAAETGETYLAAQTFYGVEVEALIGGDEEEGDGEWVRLNSLEDERRADVEAVRLFDCDGNRGEACRTVEAVKAEADRWMGD